MYINIYRYIDISVLFIFISYLYMFFYLDHNAQNCQAVVCLKAGLEDGDSEGASPFTSVQSLDLSFVDHCQDSAVKLIRCRVLSKSSPKLTC